jgi:bifunctional pyridoxal-dependent enzyme with beta-cystathionase and maltose regulon repressor activities
MILSDEIHADLTLWGRAHHPMALACRNLGYARVLTMGSPGKAYTRRGPSVILPPPFSFI